MLRGFGVAGLALAASIIAAAAQEMKSPANFIDAGRLGCGRP
jgi:hypothetical protein